MDVSIIIVNYNTLELTQKCIASIFSLTTGITFEVILIDNASSDGSRDFFSNDNRIRYRYLPQNLGFGRANNEGLTMARGRNILFLNSDTILLNNAVRILSDYLDANQRVAVCGGNLYDVNGRPNLSYETLAPSIFTAINLLLHDIPSKIFVGKSARFNYSRSPKPVAYITGADLMVRRAIIDAVGGAFNPRFFMYFEETEFCFRVKKKGYKIMSVPAAEIIHMEGGTVKLTKSNKSEWFHNSRMIYYELIGKNNTYIKIVNFLLSQRMRNLFNVK